MELRVDGALPRCYPGPINDISGATMIQKFLKDESGATAIEYALVAVLISLVVVTAGPTIASALNLTFDGVALKLL
jgi:pilus assembly protein Flp/PilA